MTNNGACIEQTGLRENIDRRIKQLREEIASKINEVSVLSRYLGGHLNPEDQLFEDAVASVDSAEIMRDVTELREAMSALNRLDSGAYGFCVECSNAIAPARLFAQPLAATCIKCQARIEAESPLISP